MPRDLFLLSAYSPPAKYALMIGGPESAGWLNGWAALWHPLAIRGAEDLPAIASPYDHETPRPGALYAVPEEPTPYLPDNWRERVRQMGGASFQATADRAETLEQLRAALRELEEDVTDFDTEPRSAFGVGLGYLAIDTLFEAMEHERTLDRKAFLEAVREGRYAEAATRLADARDTVYPAPIYWLDLAVLDAARPLPVGFSRRNPLNLIAAAETLERLPPETLAAIRSRFPVAEEDTPTLEICGGALLEREETLLPLESQLWNLRQGIARTQELTGAKVEVFARRRSPFHPLSPMLLQQAGVTRAVFLPFDGARLPPHTAAMIQWPGPDGRQVEALTREPFDAGDPQTGFHLGHYLHQTIMKDGTATMVLSHRDSVAGPWYDDLLALSELAPVLGTWTTVSRYLRDGQVGEYASVSNADDFSHDALEAADPADEHRVSRYSRHWKARRRVDAAQTYLALGQSLGISPDPAARQLVDQLEARAERGEEIPAEQWQQLEERSAQALADRLLSRAKESRPGLLLLNPCSFTRRVPLERADIAAPVGGPIKAIQPGACVVEVPGMGFAWVPTGEPAAASASRMNLADERGVRNEFFDAEIDPATGGLRAIRDPRSRDNRLGQQLVYQPGSRMIGREVRVVSRGPALGEVVTEGALVDGSERVLATFRQRFRAWLGRPLLEMRIEIYPEQPPTGYPWNAYFGARFAWRDDRATLLRSSGGLGSITHQTRPTTPEYLELRSGSQRTCLFPGGLPFHMRHGGRMLDMLLIPERESARAFEIAIGLEREQPAQAALGLASPVAVIPTEKGPPHIGPTGWLAHLDAANLWVTSLKARPGSNTVDALVLELGGMGGMATWRWARSPREAARLEPDGTVMMPLSPDGDAVPFEVGAHELAAIAFDW